MKQKLDPILPDRDIPVEEIKKLIRLTMRLATDVVWIWSLKNDSMWLNDTLNRCWVTI